MLNPDNNAETDNVHIHITPPDYESDVEDEDTIFDHIATMKWQKSMRSQKFKPKTYFSMVEIFEQKNMRKNMCLKKYFSRRVEFRLG